MFMILRNGCVMGTRLQHKSGKKKMETEISPSVYSFLMQSFQHFYLTRVFGEEYRPVPITRHIFTVATQNSSFKADMDMSLRVLECVLRWGNCKPALVFCSSRKSAATTAESVGMQMRQRGGGGNNDSNHNIDSRGGGGSYSHLFVRSDRQKTALVTASRGLNDRKVADLLVDGIAFHHAGLSFNDRGIIERTFLAGHILVLCKGGEREGEGCNE